jgi:hypothetical protein
MLSVTDYTITAPTAWLMFLTSLWWRCSGEGESDGKVPEEADLSGVTAIDQVKVNEVLTGVIAAARPGAHRVSVENPK